MHVKGFKLRGSRLGVIAGAALAVILGITFLPLRAIAGLESPCNFISDLIATNPLSSDLASTSDDHHRCIKLALKTTFPNVNGAVSSTDEQLSQINTGIFTVTPFEIENAAWRLLLDETDAASNERLYDFAGSSGQLLGRTRTDADGAGNSWLTVDRTGATVDSIAFSATALTQTNGTATGAIAKLSSDSTSGTAGLAVCATDESATNECYFMGMGSAGDLQIGKASDAGARATTAIGVTSTGTTVDSVTVSAPFFETESTQPKLLLDETDAGSNERSWLVRAQAGLFAISTALDASPSTPQANAIEIDRTGGTVDSINLLATSVQINGNGVVRSLSGTYTPTVSNTVNVDASTPLAAQYFRVGDVVTVAGEVDVDPTATLTTSFELSLPIASNFSATNNAGGGGGVNYSSVPGVLVRAVAANDTVQLIYLAGATGSADVHYTYTYLVQ